MDINPKTILKKLSSGDALTNGEVLFGMVFFKDLADQLFACGPVFLLAAKEANRAWMDLESFARARGIYKE
jgi:hypothetical protein